MYYCFFCGAEVDVTDRIKHTESCFSCKADLHCCMNCRHYDPSRKYECRELINNPIYDKVRRNYCDMFLYLEGPPREHELKELQDKAKSEADKLFSGMNPEPTEEEKTYQKNIKEQQEKQENKHKELAESLFKKKNDKTEGDT